LHLSWPSLVDILEIVAAATMPLVMLVLGGLLVKGPDNSRAWNENYA